MALLQLGDDVAVVCRDDMIGGEACGLSAAASVIGVGSDIGGSIRMPAFFNGVFGHKATTGLYARWPFLLSDLFIPLLYDCLSSQHHAYC